MAPDEDFDGAGRVAWVKEGAFDQTFGIDEFINNMPENEGCCCAPEYSNRFKVFWYPDFTILQSSVGTTQNKIKCFLQSLNKLSMGSCLVQFRALIPGEGEKKILTVSKQPFAVGGKFCKGIFRYRYNCIQYEKQLTDINEDGWFNQPSPERSTNIDSYSTEDFPLRRDAESCGFQGYLLVPLYEERYVDSILISPAGALEILTSTPKITLDINFLKTLKGAGFFTSCPPLKRQDEKPEFVTCLQCHPLGSECHSEEQQAPASSVHLTSSGSANDKNNKKGASKTSKRGYSYTEKHQITLAMLQKSFGRNISDAAKDLGVSTSTVKRLCRHYKIPRWPSHKRTGLAVLKPPQKEVDCGGKDLDSNSRSSPNYISREKEAVDENGTGISNVDQNRTLIVKAKYKDMMVKFPFPANSGIKALRENLAKRFELEAERFRIEYQDEDGDSIMISCNVDLNYYMDSLLSSGKTRMDFSILLVT